MRKKLLAVIGTVIAALVVASVALGRVAELGTTLDDNTAACPDNCQAIGQVSGFQIQKATRKNPYRLRSYGKVVAFTVKLGKPNDSQIQFFNKLFGGPPQIMLTVLKPYTPAAGEKRQANKYVLAATSPLYELTNYFGSDPTFALPRPLSIKPGYIVGMTVPTWAPAFAVNLGDDMQWRSSRDPASCDDVRQDAAQDVRGSARTYGCVYKTARLLYSVTYIPDPKPTTTPNPKSPTTPKK
ncbi:MAG TPA: hypothetical protein VE570_08965 [Thermoleophilaceae bacterium]|jgi:hypothetical protein|nr:hypothetical protein [Thermoleophilaceae bacterium]